MLKKIKYEELTCTDRIYYLKSLNKKDGNLEVEWCYLKKKVIIILVAVILVISLFPIKSQLKDGGTVEYKSLVYKISKVKRLISIEKAEQEGKVKPYEHGIVIEVLGFEIYNNVK